MRVSSIFEKILLRFCRRDDGLMAKAINFSDQQKVLNIGISL